MLTFQTLQNLLLKYPNKTNTNLFLNSVFIAAIKTGNTELMKKMLEKEMIEYDQDYTQYIYTEGRGNLESLKILCEYGYEFTSDDYFAKNEEIFLYLYNTGLEIDKNNFYLLSFHCENENEKAVEILVDIFSDHINRAFNLTDFPLIEACKNGNENIVKLLLKHGADVNIGNPLKYSCRSGNKNIVKMLLEKGIDDIKNMFIEAIKETNNTEIIEMILEASK